MLQVIDKNSQNAVNSAAKELRRNYSKKVAEKLAFLTKTSLKILSKHFASASTDIKVESENLCTNVMEMKQISFFSSYFEVNFRHTSVQVILSNIHLAPLTCVNYPAISSQINSDFNYHKL